MPLNPPSFSGQDVWYSPDTFVNKVQVALWQPPQIVDAQASVDVRAWMEGDEFASDGSPEGGAAANAYRQRLVESGTVTPEELQRASSVTPNDTTPSDRNPATSSGGTVITSTEGLENLTSFPGSTPISRYFTLSRALTYRISDFNALPLQGTPVTTRGLTKGQIVANLRLLCANVLDRIQDRYPSLYVTNTWRPESSPDGSTRKQHPRGQAADCQFSTLPFEEYYNVAVWIKDNLQFDQMLLEYNPRSAWIHISWRGDSPGNRPATTNGRPTPFKVATFNCLTAGAPGQEERFAGLVNLAGPLGLSGYSMNRRPPNPTPRRLGSSVGQPI